MGKANGTKCKDLMAAMQSVFTLAQEKKSAKGTQDDIRGIPKKVG